jgi:hypothetical protein
MIKEIWEFLSQHFRELDKRDKGIFIIGIFLLIPLILIAFGHVYGVAISIGTVSTDSTKPQGRFVFPLLLYAILCVIVVCIILYCVVRWLTYGAKTIDTALTNNTKGSPPNLMIPMVEPDYHDSTIQIFLSDWNNQALSPFYQDGRDQREGFEQAKKDVGSIPKMLRTEYAEMNKDEDGQTLIGRMQKLYEERKATYFIMTMSDKVCGVRKLFSHWHDLCRQKGMRVPVLVATVTSSPDLANAEHGIVRWYVRSEEESSLLAMYLAWACKVTHAGVFFVEHNQGRQDSIYGKRGRDEFSKRFKSLGGKEVDYFAAVGEDARAKVQKWINSCAGESEKNGKVGAFIVGYGDMLFATVSALIENDFSGPIACTTPLTGKMWQPNDRKLDANIVTVMPRLKNENDSIESDNRNIVFFFARETLRRVLEMTADDPNPLSFLDRWREGMRAAREDHNDEMEQEHLANGDVIVHVDIADSTKWRS